MGALFQDISLNLASKKTKELKRFLSYICPMTINLDKIGFKSIVSNFDLFFIDIWGVIHNGITLHDDSIKVLDYLDDAEKEFVLLTNAPRPNATVINFLNKMGLNKKKSNRVYTSGEASLIYLNKNFKNKKFYHIGPPRDFDLFKLFEKNKVRNIEKSDFIICTGLFDEHNNELSFYKRLFKNNKNKKMICTNPDLIVDRGNVREFCAGTIAKIFEEEGGLVEYFGKPHPIVYSQSTKIKGKRILCIGDNLNTDIKGANNQNFKSLLIKNGIHKKEIEKNDLKIVYKKYNAYADYVQSDLKW